MTEPLNPFYEYLEAERRELLTKLDTIEKLLGTSPRTAELRRAQRQVDYGKNVTVAGYTKYIVE